MMDVPTMVALHSLGVSVDTEVHYLATNLEDNLSALAGCADEFFALCVHYRPPYFGRTRVRYAPEDEVTAVERENPHSILLPYVRDTGAWTGDVYLPHEEATP